MDRLVYPEWFARRLLYRTPAQLLKRLRRLCRHPRLARAERRLLRPPLERFGWPALREQYRALLRLPPPPPPGDGGDGARESGGGRMGASGAPGGDSVCDAGKRGVDEC